MRLDELTDVRYAVEDGCAVVTIDRPERMNAFRGRTVDELISAFKHAWADSAVACVILTGAGDRAFCAGGDVKERAETGGYGETEWGTFEIERLHRIIRDIPKPVIAAVNGAAFGGGFDLCLLCDMRIATPDAVFAHPEIKFGAPPLFTPLQWIVGAGIARELCLTGRKVDAAEAHRIGLVNAIVDAERLETEAMATARVMAEAPQPALEATKRYLVSNAGVTFDEAFAIEHDRVFDRFLLGDL
jgi:enoyl-CoA hydratase/carnithine racemase